MTTKGEIRRRQIVETLRRIHDELGLEKVGPTRIAEEAGEGGELNPSLVISYLRGLVDEGVVEKVPQGKKRSLYRLANVTAERARKEESPHDD